MNLRILIVIALVSGVLGGSLSTFGIMFYQAGRLLDRVSLIPSYDLNDLPSDDDTKAALEHLKDMIHGRAI